jgi:hypothetical protein
MCRAAGPETNGVQCDCCHDYGLSTLTLPATSVRQVLDTEGTEQISFVELCCALRKLVRRRRASLEQDCRTLLSCMVVG